VVDSGVWPGVRAHDNFRAVDHGFCLSDLESRRPPRGHKLASAKVGFQATLGNNIDTYA
jgi:hypothetical protein